MTAAQQVHSRSHAYCHATTHKPALAQLTQTSSRAIVEIPKFHGSQFSQQKFAKQKLGTPQSGSISKASKLECKVLQEQEILVAKHST